VIEAEIAPRAHDLSIADAPECEVCPCVGATWIERRRGQIAESRHAHFLRDRIQRVDGDIVEVEEFLCSESRPGSRLGLTINWLFARNDFHFCYWGSIPVGAYSAMET
jgi:hypothetical protein